jgi:signal peptidase I
MNVFQTNDGRHYRRWVNLIPSLLLPGSTQFLSGKRRAGIVWFLCYLVVIGLLFGLLAQPKIPYSIVQLGPFEWVMPVFFLLSAGDALRRPMPCLGFKRWARCVLIGLGIPILAVLAVREFLVQPFWVPTGTMQPTIMGNRTDAAGRQLFGDHLVVNKLSYRFSQPQRGDVIAFRTEGLALVQQDAIFLKRIVGLPGETVGIEPPYLIVNGAKVMEPAIFRRIAESQNGYSGFCLPSKYMSIKSVLTSSKDRITLGPDDYLVLSDNTRNSLDGRYFGPIKRSAILGKAFYIYAPADRKGWIE